MFVSTKQFNWSQKVLTVGILLIFNFEFLFPYQTVDAQYEQVQSVKGPVLTFLKQDAGSDVKGQLVEAKVPKEIRYVVVTGYSSTPDQTDSTPFITANGKRVYDGLVASNCLPFDTLVKFPDYFGDKEFTVNDRMHPRYHCSADIWFRTRQEAIQFGVKYLKMEIY